MAKQYNIVQWRSVVLLLGGAQNLHIKKKFPNLKLLLLKNLILNTTTKIIRLYKKDKVIINEI